VGTFSYSGQPGGSDVDTVRFLVGDTDPTEPLLSDEEITWLATIWVGKGSYYYTAAMAAKAIAAKFAREVTTTSDGQTVNADQLQQKYLTMATQLLVQHESLQGSGATVDVGGIDVWDYPDPTVTSPAFGTQMHDSYDAGQQDWGDYGNQSYFDYLAGTWRRG
jgi:hypothetical protein